MSQLNRCVTILVLVLAAAEVVLADTGEVQQAVLVTGASSGIGLTITEHLSANGYYVYAGARKEADLQRLDAMDNVTSVRLDVTLQEDIDAAVQFVEAQGRGLYGVVNNAGVGTRDRISESSIESLSWMHDVNVLGPVRVNKAFLPLLEESGGRTVAIGSGSGHDAGTGIMGGYSMSKFAVEAYTDALAGDLAGTGIKVGIIDPAGGWKTPIFRKVAIRELTGIYGLDQELSAEQEAELKARLEWVESIAEPLPVAEAVTQFMSDESPRHRHMVSRTKEASDRAIKATLVRMLQLNANQPFELSRDELVAMMDDLLEKNAGLDD